MASLPMKECCITPVIHEGTPTGTVKTIRNIQTYIAQPPSSSQSPPHAAIMIMTDVLGFAFPNTRLIADQFALNGYLTLIPDVFNGDEVPFPRAPDWDFAAWKENKMPRPETVDPIYEAMIKYLREEVGVKMVGGVGYCFGGKYVCRWLKGGGRGIDAGYTAHPSFVDADEVRGIQGPLSIAAAETDEIFTVEKRHETEAILAKHTVPYQISLYSDVEHGFAVKGHMEGRKATFAKEQAFKQAMNWFNEYLREAPEPSTSL